MVLWAMDATKPYKFMGFGAMDVTKPYKFIGFGAMEATKPYEFIRFGAMEVTKPYEFIGFGAIHVTKLYKFIGFGARWGSVLTDGPCSRSYACPRGWHYWGRAGTTTEILEFFESGRPRGLGKPCQSCDSELHGELLFQNVLRIGNRSFLGSGWPRGLWRQPSKTL